MSATEGSDPPVAPTDPRAADVLVIFGVFERLAARFAYIGGDFGEPETFAQRPSGRTVMTSHNNTGGVP